MVLSIEANIVAWTLGLFGAVLAVISIYYSYTAYQNMKGGKLGQAMRKITI